MDCASFARWLADAAATLVIEPPTALVVGVHVLPLEALDGRPLDFLGVAGLDAASFPRRGRPSLLGDEERQAIHGVLGRAALPSLVGTGDARSPLAEALDRGRLGRAFVSAARVVVSRRRSGGGAPADLVQRLLAVTGTRERDLSCRQFRGSPRLPVPAGHACASRSRRPWLPTCGATPSTRWPRPPSTALTGAAWLEDARALAAIDAERLQAGAGLRPPGAHSGRLGPAGDVLAAVEARLGGTPEGPLSSTSLTALANCPFQGLSRKVLGLEPPDDGTEELDARGRGQFLHEALEQLVKRLLALGLTGADPGHPAGRPRPHRDRGRRS